MLENHLEIVQSRRKTNIKKALKADTDNIKNKYQKKSRLAEAKDDIIKKSNNLKKAINVLASSESHSKKLKNKRLRKHIKALKT